MEMELPHCIIRLKMDRKGQNVYTRNLVISSEFRLNGSSQKLGRCATFDTCASHICRYNYKLTTCKASCLALLHILPSPSLRSNQTTLCLCFKESKAWPIQGYVSKQISRRTAYHESLTYQDPNKIYSSSCLLSRRRTSSS